MVSLYDEGELIVTYGMTLSNEFTTTVYAKDSDIPGRSEQENSSLMSSKHVTCSSQNECVETDVLLTLIRSRGKACRQFSRTLAFLARAKLSSEPQPTVENTYLGPQPLSAKMGPIHCSLAGSCSCQTACRCNRRRRGWYLSSNYTSEDHLVLV